MLLRAWEDSRALTYVNFYNCVLSEKNAIKNKVLHPVNRSLDLCPPVPGVTALDKRQIGRRPRPQDPGGALSVTWCSWGSLGRAGGPGALSRWPALESPPPCQGEERGSPAGEAFGREGQSPAPAELPTRGDMMLLPRVLGEGAEGQASPGAVPAALTGTGAWVPLARTSVFRLLPLRVLFFAPLGSSNLLGV